MLLVEEPDDGDRVGQRTLAQPGTGVLVLCHAVRRAQRMVELLDVELPQLGEGGVVLALGVGVLPVPLEHVEPPRVQGEVDRGSAEERRRARRRRARAPATRP